MSVSRENTAKIERKTCNDVRVNNQRGLTFKIIFINQFEHILKDNKTHYKKKLHTYMVS